MHNERHTFLELGGVVFLFLLETILLIVVAFLIAFAIKSFIVQPFLIPSESMMPTLQPGDRVLVSKFFYKFNEPKPGDIVVFISPTDLNKDYIKRVTAVGGEKIEVKKGQVLINGEFIEESYAVKDGDLSDYGPVEIPKDSIFVMGDNRANSGDSRIFGPIKKKSILGRNFAIYWPLDRISLVN